MKTIRLYGELGERFGRVWRMDVKTPAEAIRALCSQVKGFRAHIEKYPDAGYRILTDVQPRDTETVRCPTVANTLRIVPVVCGAGKGLGQVFFGAMLIVASFYLPTTALLAGYSASASSIAFSLGTSLLLGGVSQMMTKTPSTAENSTERAENTPSFIFDGAVNTAAQGNPVPVCYGEMIVGSQVISAGLYTEQV